ncbi:MAG: hypothetical protein H6712_09260, partial [Myxococcales bacterium]|nr:hypothetical protein [Myxococcales bacterium]
RPWTTPLALGAVVLVAAALVFSRKTAGASALMPGVIGMTLVLGSALLRISSARGWSIPRALAHVSWTALAGALLWAALAPLPDHWFVTLCRVVGLAGVLVAALGPFVARRPASEPTPLESPGSGRL